MKLNSIETFSDEFVCFVRIETEDGTKGWGQVAPYCADITAQVLHRQVAPHVLGMECDDIDAMLDLLRRHGDRFARNDTRVVVAANLRFALRSLGVFARLLAASDVEVLFWTGTGEPPVSATLALSRASEGLGNIVDPQGVRTQVALVRPSFNKAIKSKIFAFDPDRFERPGLRQ